MGELVIIKSRTYVFLSLKLQMVESWEANVEAKCRDAATFILESERSGDNPC